MSIDFNCQMPVLCQVNVRMMAHSFGNAGDFLDMVNSGHEIFEAIIHAEDTPLFKIAPVF